MTPILLQTAWKSVMRLLPALIPLAAGIFLILLPIHLTDRIRNVAFDEWQKIEPRPWSSELLVRIIAIDDAAIAMEGQWPWPRDRIALLIDRLNSYSAAAIGFDIMFSEEDRLSLPEILKRLPASSERDAIEAQLKDAVLQSQNQIEGAFRKAPIALAITLVNQISEHSLSNAKSTPVILGKNPEDALPRFLGSIEPVQNLRDLVSGLGVINILPDNDLIIRTAPTAFTIHDDTQIKIMPSLSLELLRLAQRDSDDKQSLGPTAVIRLSNASGEMKSSSSPTVTSFKIGEFSAPTEADGQVRIHFAGHQPQRFISAADILSGKVDRSEIEGRILLVGVTAAGLGDIHATPIDPVLPGVEIHAEFIEHLLTGSFLARPDYARGIEILSILVFGLLLSSLARRLHPIFSGFLILIVISGVFALSFYVFSWFQWMLDPVLPATSLAAAWASVTVSAYRKSDAERKFIRSAFSRYLAPDIVKKISDHPEDLRLGGEARDVTVLFSDIRDFTTRSEHMSAEDVVRFLNHVMTPLTSEILKSGGAIDKYIGDGLMAYWNAPLNLEDHVNRACDAALKMVAEIGRLNAPQSYDMRKVEIGIGINCGPAFAGNMGSEQRFDYSLVGDTVNVSSRLESSTKLLGVDIVVSENVKKRAKDFLFVPLGKVGLKGRGETMTVYHLFDHQNNKPSHFEAFLEAHQTVLQATNKLSALEAISKAQSFDISDRYQKFYEYRNQLSP